MLITHYCRALHDIQNFSHACTIQLDDKVVVTGGYDIETKVSVYSISGWVEDLPDLNTGREQHGCGHYADENNNIVRSYYCIDFH